MMRMEQWVRHARKGGRILAVLCLFYTLKYFTFSTNLNLSLTYGFIAIKLFVMFLCGEGNGTPFQYSCLEDPMDGGAWKSTVHGVAKSQTWLRDLTFTFPFMHWRRKWQPTPVLLPGESHGGRSLVGCSPWSCKEWGTTERLAHSKM